MAVPGRILQGQGREGMALDITATAPALFLVLLFIDITLLIQEKDSFKPETLSQDDLLCIAHELGPSWIMLGRVLNVPNAVIDQIEANKSEVSEKCACKCNCLLCVVIMG